MLNDEHVNKLLLNVCQKKRHEHRKGKEESCLHCSFGRGETQAWVFHNPDFFSTPFCESAIITCSSLSSVLAVIPMSQSLYFQVLILLSKFSENTSRLKNSAKIGIFI